MRLPCRTLMGFVLFFTVNAVPAEPAPSTVSAVDLPRYMGTWYEIAYLPNRFQRNCVGDTTATYTLRKDGKVDVLNRCRLANDKFKTAAGLARVTDPLTNAKLKVSFVHLFSWHLFWGDYWVLDLPADYTTVIVGHPTRKYGWILSRTPVISPVRRAELDARLRDLGYDPAKFVSTSHSSDAQFEQR